MVVYYNLSIYVIMGWGKVIDCDDSSFQNNIDCENI